MADDDLSSPAPTRDSLESLLGRAVEAPASLAPGQVIAGRFKIEGLLGSGGMGTVYRARDARLERAVAIKLHQKGGDAPRLEREAVAMARLAHPNVVAVYEVGALGDRPFVAMELVDGATLRAWITGKSERERLRVLIEAGRGLAAAHAAGLVHRDFKPENVLVGTDGRARVGDFGLAAGRGEQVPQPAAPSQVMDSEITHAGAVIGTPAYMAPEQAAGARVDARADQYAFCLVAWEALGGARHPDGKLPPRQRAVLSRGLATDPAARYPAMEPLLADLARPPPRRWPWLLLLAPIAAIALLAIQLRDDAPDCTPHLGALLPALAGQPPEVATWRQALGARETQVCHAIASGALPPRAHDCLELRVRTAAALLDDPGAPPAIQLQEARDLPALADCADPANVAAQNLPADPAKRAVYIAARAQLAAAHASFDLGQLARAQARYDAVAASPAANQAGVRAMLDYLHGRLLVRADKHAEAVAALEAAYYAARKYDDLDVLLGASATLVNETEEAGMGRAQTEQWIQTAIADADRVAERVPARAAATYAMVAARVVVSGDLANAERLAAAAVAAVGPAPSQARLEYLGIAAEVACARNRPTCLAQHREVIAMARGLTTDPWRVANLLDRAAQDLAQTGMPKEALALAREAVDMNAGGVLDRATHAETFGALELEAGNDAEVADAPATLRRARDGMIATLGATHPDVGVADGMIARAELAVGDRPAATEAFEAARAIRVEQPAEETELACLAAELANGNPQTCEDGAKRVAGKLDEARYLTVAARTGRSLTDAKRALKVRPAAGPSPIRAGALCVEAALDPLRRTAALAEAQAIATAFGRAVACPR